VAKETRFNAMLQAMMDSRAVVLSLMKQLGMHSYRDRELGIIVRQCALDLLAKAPAHAVAIGAPIPGKKKRSRRLPRGRRRK
jgi:hypothetical protein